MADHHGRGGTAYAVDMVSSTDGWVVGRDDDIYHYDGSVWSWHTTTAEGETHLAVNILSGEEAWAVGRDGHIYIDD